MSYGYWIKMHHNLLDDYRLWMLSDATKWRYVACNLMAGELNEDGFLPPMMAMLFKLRPLSQSELENDLRSMATCGLAELRVHPSGEERWFLSDFAERQRSMSDAERQARRRSQDRSKRDVSRERHEHVTKRDTDIDIDRDTDREGEKKQTPRVISGPISRDAAPPPSSLPPGVTRQQDNAATVPPKPKRPLTADEQRVSTVLDAISEVTGVSARLNFTTVLDQAQAIDEAGYTADQLRRHYGRERTPGTWNWYADDWRGKKGDLPTYKNITDTIAAATATVNRTAPARRKDGFAMLLEQAEMEAAENAKSKR